MDTMRNDQRIVCQTFGSAYIPALDHQKVGVSRNIQTGIVPLNGLRHPPTGDTTGWYLWAGEELPSDEDFFLPLHVSHLGEWCPEIVKFLALEPGWRFLKDGEYEDVWFDPSLVRVD
jgi:hypothetical protein